MNLRTDSHSLRFRLAAEDLAALQRDGELAAATALEPALALRYRVRCAALPAPSTRELLTLTSSADAGGLSLTLTVTPAALAQLAAGAAGKDGIRDFLSGDNGEILTLDLDVDIRSGRPK